MRVFDGHRTLRRGDRGSTLLIVLALLSVLVLLATTLTFTSRLEVLSAHHFGEGVQRRTAVLTGVDDGGLALVQALPSDAVGPLDMALDINHLADHTGATTDLRAAIAELTIEEREKTRERLLRAIEQDASIDFPMTETLVGDSSARLNLNTASYTHLALMIESASARIPGSNVNARDIARRIVQWRLGPDGAPGAKGVDDNRNRRFGISWEADEEFSSRWLDGEAFKTWRHLKPFLNSLTANPGQSPYDQLENLLANVDEPQEYIADVRFPSFGDDRRFESIGDLYDIHGVTPELVRELQPYVTVFSLSRDAMPAGHEGYAKVDINRASALEIYNALKTEYGSEKDDLLLLQFAVNIVDQRDSDSIPTVLSHSTGTVFGLERTPRLSEVYPDSRTPDERGDDGQFVEIQNPWSTDLDLTGWTLSVGGTNLPLQGRLRPSELLIVTDDYDNAMDSAADDDVKGTGSFYDVFGVVHGSRARVLELPLLNIFHQPGTYDVDLLSPEGVLADRMTYTIPRNEEWSTLDSFSRPITFASQAVRETASPFRAVDTNSTSLGSQPEIANVPFVDVAELFGVFVDYASGDENQLRAGYAVPVSPASQSSGARYLAQSADILDARIVDVLTVEFGKFFTEMEWDQFIAEKGDVAIIDPWSDDLKADLTSKSRLSRRDAVQEAEALAFTRLAPPMVGWQQGRVNLNTAPTEVLKSLGISDAAARAFIKRRDKAMLDAVNAGQQSAVLFNRLSDVVVDEELWGSFDYDQYLTELRDQKGTIMPPLVDYDPDCNCFAGRDGEVGTAGYLSQKQGQGVGLALLPYITLGSRSFFLEGQALDASNDSEPEVSYVKARALVSLDRGEPEVVSLEFVH